MPMAWNRSFFVLVGAKPDGADGTFGPFVVNSIRPFVVNSNGSLAGRRLETHEQSQALGGHSESVLVAVRMVLMRVRLLD